ncbi:putative Cytochrome P450 81D11 [Cocos nucifera]|uniref:Putative Cytochrome P450 81D11 n=1 Tax=Cocos nucifera TaxID=13894 RepID=A0A8K0NCV6_COCNU|nr:putative Cytochrome P450 81D11 [Cocos nucifera]
MAHTGATSAARVAAFSASRAVDVCSLLRHLFRNGDKNEFRKVEMKSRFSELTFNVAMQMITGRSAEKRMMLLMREMNELLQETVEERRKKRGREDEKKTIIDVMLEMLEVEAGYYTDEIIKGMILNLIAAGTDTSAGTMEWAMALLRNRPKALKKAKAEIDMQVGLARLVTDHDLLSLHYLQNIIEETLRLFPAGPLLVPHEPSEQYCGMQEYSVLRGTMLLVNAYALQRDPQL